MNDFKNIGPQIPQPSDHEITKAIQEVKDKYGVDLTHEDAKRYAMLRAELGWWLTVEQGLDTERMVTDEMAKEFQELIQKEYNEEISLEEARNRARLSLDIALDSEKQRIATEIRSLIKSDSE